MSSEPAPNLHIHQRIHTGRGSTSAGSAGRGFSQSSNLHIHRCSHTGVAVPVLRVREGSQPELRPGIHLRVHTGRSPITLCAGKVEGLQPELQTPHPPESPHWEKPYECNQWGRASARAPTSTSTSGSTGKTPLLRSSITCCHSKDFNISNITLTYILRI